jgi:hypothetical protein
MVGFGFFFQPLMVVMVTLWGLVPFMELCHLLRPLLSVSVLLMGRVIYLTYSQLSFERLCCLCFLFSCKSHFPFPPSNKKIKKKKEFVRVENNHFMKSLCETVQYIIGILQHLECILQWMDSLVCEGEN